MATIGSLEPLMDALTSAPTLAGASVVFGEENLASNEYPLPRVVVTPIGGNWESPGYYKDANPDVTAIWKTDENIELSLWAESTDPTRQLPIHHATAVEDFRAAVLQALQAQRSTGLFYKPVSGRWQLDQDAVSRLGRSYVLTVVVEITVPDVVPIEATYTSVTLTEEIQT
jgi:hypothetical protein